MVWATGPFAGTAVPLSNRFGVCARSPLTGIWGEAECGGHWANDLKKGVAALATIGATAPFVGLLGTVVGIITAFQGIAATGSGGLGAVSAGISEALVETALGLVVAIPAVWFYNYLTGRIEYFNVEMDNSSSELVDYFIKKTA